MPIILGNKGTWTPWEGLSNLRSHRTGFTITVQKMQHSLGKTHLFYRTQPTVASSKTRVLTTGTQLDIFIYKAVPVKWALASIHVVELICSVNQTH